MDVIDKKGSQFVKELEEKTGKELSKEAKTTLAYTYKMGYVDSIKDFTDILHEKGIVGALQYFKETILNLD